MIAWATHPRSPSHKLSQRSYTLVLAQTRPALFGANAMGSCLALIDTVRNTLAARLIRCSRLRLLPAGTSKTSLIQRGNIVRRQEEVRSLGETFYLRDAGGASDRRGDALARH
jgi:hypothetical protein